jgi:outer membrane protein OmpA-like peptidoglycan-associated protein
MEMGLSKHWRWALAVAALAALTVSAAGQRPEIAIDPPGGLDLPRPPPVNHLARCLADPEDKISCHVARTAKRDGGLESAVVGHINASVYVPCRRGSGVCLEVATFDADEPSGPGAGAGEPARLPSIDVDILFDYDRADIRASEEAKLKQLADAMLHPQAAGVRFFIVGHTDGKGPDAYNCRLSSGRAGSVRERLAALGVPPTRLTVIGAGKHVLRNSTDPLAAENRRVGFAKAGGSGDAVIARMSMLCTK